MNVNGDYSNTRVPPGVVDVAQEETIVNGQIIDGTEVIKNDVVDAILKTFPTEGKLIQGPRNSYILELSGDSFDEMYEYVKAEYGKDLLKGSVADVGYHISVIRASIGDRVVSPGEMGIILGENIAFEPRHLCSISPDQGPWENIYMVNVKAKALEKIRTDLGMGPKIKIGERELDYHISIANKPRAVVAPAPAPVAPVAAEAQDTGPAA